MMGQALSVCAHDTHGGSHAEAAVAIVVGEWRTSFLLRYGGVLVVC